MKKVIKKTIVSGIIKKLILALIVFASNILTAQIDRSIPDPGPAPEIKFKSPITKKLNKFSGENTNSNFCAKHVFLLKGNASLVQSSVADCDLPSTSSSAVRKFFKLIWTERMASR